MRGRILKISVVQLCFILAVASFPSLLEAALWDRGGGLIYDDHLDVTFLQDANYAMTSGYVTLDGRDISTTDGRMNFDEAGVWVENLAFQGYTDWRLPTKAGDELKHLILSEGINPVVATISPFVNLVYETAYDPNAWYWTGTPFYAFSFQYVGYYTHSPTDNYHRIWAVRDGDSSPQAVPEPASMLLLGGGLMGLVGMRVGSRG